MVVTDPPSEAVPVGRWRTGGSSRVATNTVEPLWPMLITIGVMAGLALIIVDTPITGRGDYGQWLMTSRYYLSQDVPDYRTITALPPVIPALLALIRVAVPDPVMALQVISLALLVGTGTGLYLAGALLLGSRWAGAFGAVIGLLVTDRFLELFAFGGLLQLGSLLCVSVSVGAFARASRETQVRYRWWLLGTSAMALAALTHVGTGMIAVPTGLAAAALAAVALRRVGWRQLARPLLPLLLAVGGVAAYWLLVLLPASGDYLTNPASLAYRGPGRLLDSLFTYGPTTAVVALGSIAIVVGCVADLRRRRISGWLFLLTWIGVTWGALLYSVASGAATDYPRFATPLLAPLAVAAGGGVWRLLEVGSQWLVRDRLRLAGSLLAPAVLFLATIVAAPLTVGRYERQVSIYQPRHAASLTAAVQWLDAEIAQGRAVLTEVRDGKWVEGLTGRPALFSQAVRYAFRPIEWQRSVEADALLRSVVTVTSGRISAQYTSMAAFKDGRVPTGLLLRVNHGGEFVDLLRVPPAATDITGDQGVVTAAGLVPVRVREHAAERQAGIATVWGLTGDPEFSFTQRVTAYQDGTTLRISQVAPGHRISTELVPPPGITITSIAVTGPQAVACFTSFGGSAPCVRIHAAQDGARVTETTDGTLRVTSDSSHLDVLVTALTSGDASVGLAVLVPTELVARHDLGAALLYEPDPAYASRRLRLEALGFEEARAFGPYRVLIREEGSSP
jgi:hypothetical protein